MKPILIVNLYLSPKRKLGFSNLVSRFKELGVDTSIGSHEELPRSDPSLLAGSYSGIILSGTEALYTRTSDRKQFEDLLAFLPRIEMPMLGICGGHQALALAYGGEVAKVGRLVSGFRTVELEDKDHLLAGLAGKVRVMQSHYEHVKHLPPTFVRIATSKDTKIEAMKHNEKPVYGVQFHPERWNAQNQAGKRILENFVNEIARK